MTSEELHDLFGDIRQFASDIITYEHHGFAYPEADEAQIQALQRGRDALSQVYYLMFEAYTAREEGDE